MSVTQTEFRNAILDPNAEVPTGMIDEQGRPAGKRFNVYRNNVAVGLTDALEIAFPVVFKLVGEEFFHAMAGAFLRLHQPTTPMMMFYGEKFPFFLRKFKPVAHLGYLADVALLEQRIRECYHGADADPFDPQMLQQLSTEALMTSRIRIAPSAILMRSTWPVYSIWQVNTVEGAPQPVMQGEDVLISRVNFDPLPQLLPAGGADFIESLQSGDSFAAALGKAKTIEANFDLTTTLGALIKGHAITAIEHD